MVEEQDKVQQKFERQNQRPQAPKRQDPRSQIPKRHHQKPQVIDGQRRFNRPKTKFNNNPIFEYKKPENKGDIVSRDKMLEAGVCFGQRTMQWNPKMKPYILMVKRRVHIIDIQKTKKALEFAYILINKFAQKGANFIFVGTRKEAKATIKENALRTNSSYVSERWLGGTLTNNRTIFQRVRRMNNLEKLQENNFEGYTKKEGVMFSKELLKLQKNLTGIREMRSRPNVMIVADPNNDEIAVKEAKKLGMKVVGIVDTNADPTIIDVVIPANDDSIKSVTLIITILADAIAQAKGGVIKFAYQPNEKIVLPDELKVERKPRSRFNNRQTRFNNRNVKDFKKEPFSNDEITKIKSVKNISKIESTKLASQKVKSAQIDDQSIKENIEEVKTPIKKTIESKKITTNSLEKEENLKNTKNVIQKTKEIERDK